MCACVRVCVCENSKIFEIAENLNLFNTLACKCYTFGTILKKEYSSGVC